MVMHVRVLALELEVLKHVICVNTSVAYLVATIRIAHYVMTVWEAHKPLLQIHVVVALTVLNIAQFVQTMLIIQLVQPASQLMLHKFLVVVIHIAQTTVHHNILVLDLLVVHQRIRS